MSDTIKKIEKQIKDTMVLAERDYYQTAQSMLGLEMADARIKVSKMFSVLQKMVSGDDWFDIESAPKDGTECLLKCKMGIEIGSYRIDDGFGGDEPLWLDRSFDSFSTGYFSNPLNPTHWKHIDSAKHINMMMESELGGREHD